MWEECGLILVASFDSILEIIFTDSLNSSDLGVIVGMFLCGLDAMVSIKAEYL